MEEAGGGGGTEDRLYAKILYVREMIRVHANKEVLLRALPGTSIIIIVRILTLGAKGKR